MRELNWLNVDFVQTVLQKNHNDDSIRVSKIALSPATSKGDNYMSEMYRVIIEFSRIYNGHNISESTSLIAKIAPEDTVLSEMISDAGFFRTETSMMLETLPKMNEMLSTINVTSLGAECLQGQYETLIYLIMEDLAPLGYRTADSHEGLDLDHSLLVIRNLANFHASSVALAEKDPENIRKYKRGIFHKDNPKWITQFFDPCLKALATEVAKWRELGPRISEKLLKLHAEGYCEKAAEVTAFRENDFNVLNHGDCWANNIMFRYNEKQKPIGLKFVDFQLSYYGSPAVDLLYFLGSSIRDDLRVESREFLLHEYHRTLSDTMNKLKCTTEVPSFEKFKDILEDRAFYEVVSTLSISSAVLADKNQMQSFTEMMKPDGTVENPAHKGRLYRKVMTRILPFYDSKGLLN